MMVAMNMMYDHNADADADDSDGDCETDGFTSSVDFASSAGRR